MNDISLDDDFLPLTIEQISELAETIREVFGCYLSRADFADKLLMFLEDVPGYEVGGVPESLIESAWITYIAAIKVARLPMVDINWQHRASKYNGWPSFHA